MEKAISLWKKRDDETKILDNLVIIVAQKFCSIHRRPGSEVKKFVDEIDLFKFLGDDLEMYRKITQSMDYADENQKAIEILEEAGKKISFHTNYTFELQLLSRRSKSKPEEWIRREYTFFRKIYKFEPRFVYHLCSSSKVVIPRRNLFDTSSQARKPTA